MSAPEQAKTRTVKIFTMMKTREFRDGVADGFEGKPFNYDGYRSDKQWSYERGRIFGIVARQRGRLPILPRRGDEGRDFQSQLNEVGELVSQKVII